MSERNEENLRELFEGFVGPEQPDEAVEDIVKAEQILRDNPAPEPSKELINSIKSQVTWSLLRRREHIRRMRYEAVAAVAAAVLVVATIGTKLFKWNQGRTERIYAASIVAPWEGEDPYLAVLTSEVEQIENDVLTLEKGRTNGRSKRAVDELEVEVIEINSDFEKGQFIWM